jgi:Ni,Fe-hydrogenase III large subunit
MAKTQRRRKMSRCRRNKSRSLKGGTKASSKSHIAAAAAPASSLAIKKLPGESSADHLARVLARVSEIAKSAVPAVAKRVKKSLTEEEKDLIAMQRKINARNAEVRSAAHSRSHGDSSHAAYMRAAYAARGNGNPQ